jgi:hypothetical protein
VGPVLFRALRRLAVTCASDAMGVFFLSREIVPGGKAGGRLKA